MSCRDKIAGLEAQENSESTIHLALGCARFVAEAVSEYQGYVWGKGATAEASCGSGLCGPVFAPLGESLVGVEPLAALADLARDLRNAGAAPYTHVVTADVSSFFQANASAFDLVICATACSSCGALDNWLGAFATSVRPQGLVAFTLTYAEEGTPRGFAADGHGGYRHSETYVRSALRQVGLAAKLVHPVAVGAGATGVNRLLVLAKKPR